MMRFSRPKLFVAMVAGYLCVLNPLLAQQDTDAKKRFAEAASIAERIDLARMFIYQGRDETGRYYDFLLSQVEIVAESGIPSPLDRAKMEGKLPAAWSAELIDWAEKQGIDVEEAARLAVFEYPGRVLKLPLQDERAVDVLCRCVGATNPHVSVAATYTLAMHQEQACLDLIIDRAMKMRSDLRESMIEHLTRFDDATAYEAAKALAVVVGKQHLLDSVKEQQLRLQIPDQ